MLALHCSGSRNGDVGSEEPAGKMYCLGSSPAYGFATKAYASDVPARQTGDTPSSIADTTTKGNMEHFLLMRMLVDVVDCGRFAGNARKLNLSSLAVNRGVLELEQRLGARLLTRTAGSV